MVFVLAVATIRERWRRRGLGVVVSEWRVKGSAAGARKHERRLDRGGTRSVGWVDWALALFRRCEGGGGGGGRCRRRRLGFGAAAGPDARRWAASRTAFCRRATFGVDRVGD